MVRPSMTDWPLNGISRSQYFSTLNVSKMTRDRATVTIEHQLEVICALSNGDIFNDLDGPLIRFSRSRHFWSQIFQKRCILRTKLLWDRKPYQGRRQGFRPGWAKWSAEKIFRLPTLVFSLPTLPYVTVAHPAHRTEADLREKASLATNQEGTLPSSPLRLT